MASRDFNPFDLFLQLENDLMRSAEGVMRDLRFQPRADMYETDTALIVKIEIGGIRGEHLNITLSPDDRVLTISGERVETAEERANRIKCYQLEIYFGSFEREIVLPTSVRFDRDNITANYREGFLVISMPKRDEPPPGKRVIEISNGE